MPAFGLGTWKSAPGEVGAAVSEALRIGYRHIDCAAIYANEAEVGEALAAAFAGGVVEREQVWVTSKLWNDCHAPEHVIPALRKTLADLRLERLDLYLIHWPVALRHGHLLPEHPEDFVSLAELPLAATWAELERAVELGLTSHIGVSNFSARKLDELFASASSIKPELNQIELHPYLQQPKLLSRCAELGVAVTAYSPLGSRDRPPHLRQEDEPLLLEEPLLAQVAARHEATPAQVLIAWALARGTSVIPKSTNPWRIAENFAATRLELSADDMHAIAGLDRHRRYVDGAFWATPGSPYSIANLWDED